MRVVGYIPTQKMINMISDVYVGVAAVTVFTSVPVLEYLSLICIYFVQDKKNYVYS